MNILKIKIDCAVAKVVNKSNEKRELIHQILIDPYCFDPLWQTNSLGVPYGIYGEFRSNRTCNFIDFFHLNVVLQIVHLMFVDS